MIFGELSNLKKKRSSRAFFKKVYKDDSLYEPTTAYPTAGPKPNMNNSSPVALPSSGTGMHSLIIGINNGVNIVPHIPEIDYVVKDLLS